MRHAELDANLSTGGKIHVIQGGYHISDDNSVVLTTVLGSCVAACLWDRERGVGGMNHFLLAQSEGGEDHGAAERYGAYAMEVLINGLISRGCARDRLSAKLFGGARMFEGLSDIGACNARFARAFLAAEGIPVESESLGGDSARRVEFWPASGRVRQKLLSARQAPAPLLAPAPAPAPVGDVELF